MKKIILTLTLITISGSSYAMDQRDFQRRLHDETVEEQKRLHRENMDLQKKVENVIHSQGLKSHALQKKSLLTQQMIACSLLSEKETKIGWTLKTLCNEVMQKFETMLERDLKESTR
jgi:hypothetical protein